MSYSQTFRTAYTKVNAAADEDLFLSITPRFELGPGIRRDGLTEPRMLDPHSVSYVVGGPISTEWEKLPETTNPFVQRAGTWTVFHHVAAFCKEYGSRYQLIGVQSCGDLTMNPWHVALVQRNHKRMLCHLSAAVDRHLTEPYQDRVYRCLVKWRHSSVERHSGGTSHRYEFLDLKFSRVSPENYSATLADSTDVSRPPMPLKDVSRQIEFALSGKPIIQKKAEIPLANIIDRFQDVRHVFNLPSVPASGSFKGVSVQRLNFGEYWLYNDLNVRRAALNSPVIVDWAVPGSGVQVDSAGAFNMLDKKHYTPEDESPSRRGRYRRYSDRSIEIFYPHNVYPFGVLGGKPDEVVCLASGGLSGRVGNTLEGITRIMHDFFGCEDALVLDEGYDTFLIINPNQKRKEEDNDNYVYGNQDFLNKIAAFAAWQAERDHDESQLHDYALDTNRAGAKAWPLNKPLFRELEEYCRQNSVAPCDPATLDIMAVAPHRCQMRAVLILAKRRQTQDSTNPRR